MNQSITTDNPIASHQPRKPQPPQRHRSFVARGAIIGTLAGLLMVGGWSLEARACPNCRDAVAETAGSGPGQPAAELAAGYNYSILFMIGMMYAVVGGSGVLLWHAVRKHAPPREALMGEGQ